MIKHCSCAHEFQDKTYGKGMRLHNHCKEDKARCTVCGALKAAPTSKEDKKVKS